MPAHQENALAASLKNTATYFSSRPFINSQKAIPITSPIGPWSRVLKPASKPLPPKF